jgi:putative iron-regulated protein
MDNISAILIPIKLLGIKLKVANVLIQRSFMKKMVLVVWLFLIGSSLAQDLKQQAVKTYADIVFASYQDTLVLTETLQDAIDAFLADPNQETMNAAKEVWLAAREPYGQTEAYRFYGGPIDDEDGPEGLINAWPLDEVYIDYVEGAPEAGIINNLTAYPEINKELLVSLNEVGAEENISTGFHAIEFLLWGQDLSAESNGQRLYTDYTTATNADRRSAYLAAAAELLLEDIKTLVDAWNPELSGNYRETFLALGPDEALQNMFTGMGVLSKSELPGERIFTAYDNQDQEDEHSCFSDNTHRDIANNFQGIENVYVGNYIRIDGSMVTGVGLKDVIADLDPSLNDEMLGLLEQAKKETQALYVPFDQAIINEDTRPQVLRLVSSLLDLGDKIAEVGGTLGLTINTALPE